MFDIEKFLLKENIEYRSSGKNIGKGNIGICCPVCLEGRYHCSISLLKSVYTCWICSDRGDYSKLISKLKGISYDEASEIINAKSQLKQLLEERDLKLVSQDKKEFTIVSLPHHTRPFFSENSCIWQRFALGFIKNKYDLCLDEIIDAQLMYCYHGEYKNRIIVPVFKNNKLISFLGRTWDTNCDKRYMNAKGTYIKNTLYNIDNIKKNQNLLVVVEGVFDAIKVGLNRAVATFGTEITDEQKKLLIELRPKKLVVMTDNDADPNTNNSVNKKAQELVDYLSAFMNTQLIKIPYIGKDPADLSKKDIDRLLNII